MQLEKELAEKTYKPGKSICFAISDPKLREIFAADFRDRIIHHLLVGYLEPIFEKKFIFHSYACRTEKGAQAAVINLQKVLKNDPANKYYLQIDIKSFFMNIHKDILFSIITRYVKNPHILWLTQIIIMNNPTDNYHKKGDIKLHSQIPPEKSLFGVPQIQGLPIGNLTSQFFANVYMNKVDQFIKHTLKAKHYFRYVDDLLILNNNREQLKDWRIKINDFLNEKLKLGLHPEKDILKTISEGINFVGYIIKPDNILIRNKTVKRLKNKLYKFNKKVLNHVNKKNIGTACNEIFVHPYSIMNNSNIVTDFKNIFCAINSYYGLFRVADTYKLRKHLYEKHFGILQIYLRPANNSFDYFSWSEPKK